MEHLANKILVLKNTETTLKKHFQFKLNIKNVQIHRDKFDQKFAKVATGKSKTVGTKVTSTH